jgi:signal transduction histidine kinase
MSILDWLLDPTGLTAHGFCLSWAPGLVALHAGADAVIGLAYFSIPLALFAFVRRRRDLKFRGTVYLFIAFILACGATHLLSILTLWVPVYGIEGLVKALTAVLSVVTAMALWPLLPLALALPTPTELRTANERLAAMVADLELRVAERTEALEAANRELHAIVEQREKLIEELTTSNVERDQFVHAASHDLREPLRMASAFSALLSDGYAERLDHRGKDFLANVIQATGHMNLLLDDLVSFARLGADAEKASWFSTEDVFEQVLVMVGDEARAVGARIERTSALPRLFANPIRFHRLMQNLIGNALKYVPAGVSPLVQVSAERTGGFWTFSVKDNGIGIDPRFFQRIFEPFKRLHAKSDYPGTGLGLAICRKIVEGFGGRISVCSEEGQGSTFSFTVKDPEADDVDAKVSGPLRPSAVSPG